MIYLPNSSSPPSDWTGEMNRRSAQATGLVAWYSAMNRPVGMAEYVARYAATVQNLPGRRFNPAIGVGVDLNGTDQRVNSVDIEDITGPFTISMWTILDTLPASGATRELVNKADSTGGYSLFFVNSGGTHQVGSVTLNGAGNTTNVVNYTLPTATPFHLTATFDGANSRYYLNGQQIGAAQANTRNPAGVTKSLVIGAFGYYTPSGGDLVPNRWTDGAIFDVRIWRRALSAAEIWSLYAPNTRWELYQPPRPMVWWVPPSGAQTYYQTLAAEVEPLTEPNGATPNAPIKHTARTLAAALTPAAALTYLKAFFRTLTASLTPTGNLVKLPGKSLPAGLTPAAGMLKRTGRTLTANNTEAFPRAILRRVTARTVTAGLTPTAALSYLKAFFRTLTAGLTPAGNLDRRTDRTLTAEIEPLTEPNGATPNAPIKRTLRTLAASLTPAAALSYLKAFFRTLTAGVTPTGNLIKLPGKSLTAGVAPAVSLVKRTSRTLAGALTPAAALSYLKAFFRTLTASLTPTATLSTLRAFVRTLTAGLTPDGSLVRRTERTLLAGLMPVGSVIRFLVGALSGRARCTLTIEAATVAGLSMVNATRCRLEMSEV